MSRTHKSILILFVVLFAVLFAVKFSQTPKPELVVAQANSQTTGYAYLPLVVVNRGEAEVVVVVEPADDPIRIDRPIKIERPVTITDPCDSRNDPEGNPDPHPCPQRHSGQADEHSAPWPVPEPSPSQPKHQQQPQPTGGKRGG